VGEIVVAGNLDYENGAHVSITCMSFNPLIFFKRERVGLGLWCYTTFNNISVISWWSVLLVEETGVPVENH
jgi:hypothetical protein